MAHKDEIKYEFGVVTGRWLRAVDKDLNEVCIKISEIESLSGVSGGVVLRTTSGCEYKFTLKFKDMMEYAII